MARGRFRNLKGGRGQRTGEDYWVGQRESEEYRRLLQKRNGWCISGNMAYASYDTRSSGHPSAGSTYYLFLQETDRQFTITHLKTQFNSGTGIFALYYWEDRRLHIIPGTEVTASGTGGTQLFELNSPVIIPPECRLVAAFQPVIVGDGAMLRNVQSVIQVKEAPTLSTFVREFEQDILVDYNPNPQFPDFAYLSTDASNVL